MIRIVAAWAFLPASLLMRGLSPGSDRGTGRAQARKQRARGKGYAASLILFLFGSLSATADTLRVATWHTELQRQGPGLLLRDILRGEDAGIAAVRAVIDKVSPDILLLTGIDWDLGLATVNALSEGLQAPYPHVFALRPNSGLSTGLDMDGDGRPGGPRDAQGYGRFAGQGGMALLSRLPVDLDAVRDFSGLLWADVPDALLPEVNGAPFPSAEALAIQRLSSVGHWDVPVILGSGGRLHLLAFAAGPPVFDGPEDRNGKRNHDEVAIWSLYLNGQLDLAPPDAHVVVLGLANLDPVDGEGLHDAIAGLLSHTRLQDPAPSSPGAAEAAGTQGGVNAAHVANPSFDTADWRDENGPGNLRVSYVLPHAALAVRGAGVFWPGNDDPLHRLIGTEGAPRHRLVWVDLEVGG